MNVNVYHKILFLKSSNFFSTSEGVLSSSSLSYFCFINDKRLNSSQRSPSITALTGTNEDLKEICSRPPKD